MADLKTGEAFLQLNLAYLAAIDTSCQRPAVHFGHQLAEHIFIVMLDQGSNSPTGLIAYPARHTEPNCSIAGEDAVINALHQA